MAQDEPEVFRFHKVDLNFKTFLPSKARRRRPELASSRGSVVLWGLTACALVGVATVTASRYYESFSAQAHLSSVRSRLTAVESLVRNMAFQPYAYKCGSDNGQSAVANVSSCQINATYFDGVRDFTVAGADCANGLGNCGFHLDGPFFAPAGPAGTFTATITYQGREATQIRPSTISLTIPTELLKSSTFDCAAENPKRPVMVGFNADGSPNCRGFTAIVNGNPLPETEPCPKGTYATNVNFDKLTIQCDNLDTPDKQIACGYGETIGSVTWTNGVVGSSCTPLPPAPFP